MLSDKELALIRDDELKPADVVMPAGDDVLSVNEWNRGNCAECPRVGKRPDASAWINAIKKMLGVWRWK